MHICNIKICITCLNHSELGKINWKLRTQDYSTIPSNEIIQKLSLIIIFDLYTKRFSSIFELKGNIGNINTFICYVFYFYEKLKIIYF